MIRSKLQNSHNISQHKNHGLACAKGEFFQAVRMEKNMMGLLISLIIVVAISNIVTSLSLMVVDKQGEIAILQTQGLTKSQVRSVFIYQGLLVGFVGTLLGAILGVLATLNLTEIVSAVNPQGVFLPTELSFVQMILSLDFRCYFPCFQPFILLIELRK